MATTMQMPVNDQIKGEHYLQMANLPTTFDPENDKVDPDKVVQDWLDRLHNVLKSPSIKDDLTKVFLSEECFWRDQLCLGWDLRTLKNIEPISTYLLNPSTHSRLASFSLTIDSSTPLHKPSIAPIDAHSKSRCISSFLSVATDVGSGHGIVRLCPDPLDGVWKAFTLFTALSSLQGHEESTFHNRPNGVEHGLHEGRKNWKEMREEAVEYRDREPDVVIIGTGQAGLSLAARLKTLRVSTLLIDQNARIGDSWRKRYHQLVLHDPVWYDHLPYMPFPPFWPRFCPKDKLADWFEAYAAALELDAWLSTTLKTCVYDDATRKWSVELERVRDGGKREIRTLHPTFLVLATGVSGTPSLPLIPGLPDPKDPSASPSPFPGQIFHSSSFPGARPPPSSSSSSSPASHALIVGAANSAHDIAHSYLEAGWRVTLIQRSSTCVVSSDAALEFLLGGLYCEGGPDTLDADLVFASLPAAVLKRVHVDLTRMAGDKDRLTREGLEGRGFRVDEGPEGAGLFLKYLARGGGYYIDVGATRGVVEGGIQVRSGKGVVGVVDQGVVLESKGDGAGEVLKGDEIVFATGFGDMLTTAELVFGPEVVKRVRGKGLDKVWGFDAEGELRGVWKRTGHPGVWLVGGNMALCRYYSGVVAVQVKALLEGVAPWGEV